jgi:hypothetical protein
MIQKLTLKRSSRVIWKNNSACLSGSSFEEYLHQAVGKKRVERDSVGIEGGGAYLARDTGRDDHDLDALESLVELVSRVADNLQQGKSELCNHVGSTKDELTSLGVSTWLTSAATPGAPRISYRLRDVTSLFCLSSSERGCPIPPPAPSTATFVWREAEEEKWRVLDRERAAERASMSGRRQQVGFLCGWLWSTRGRKMETRSKPEPAFMRHIRSGSDNLPSNTDTTTTTTATTTTTRHVTTTRVVLHGAQRYSCMNGHRLLG